MSNAIRFTCQVSSLLLFVALLHAQPGKKFEPGCPLPFDAIKKKTLKVDKTCGITGADKTASARAAQNRAKNNFCATGTPLSLSFADFSRLQQRVEEVKLPFGPTKQGAFFVENLPKDRAPLRDILKLAGGQTVGEGQVVVVEGFVIGARHSNTKLSKFRNIPGKGESVNCGSGELADNDIHIDLVETLADITNHCAAITAEISPHFRPAVWDRFDLGPATQKAAKGIKELKEARVRITGQLFFDASHTPCKNGMPSTPAQRSSWEVHPVYAIEVFDVKTNQFAPLDQWAKGK